MLKVTAVHPDFLGAELGLLPGTELLSVNGREIEDFLDWEFLTAEEQFLLHVRQPDGDFDMHEVVLGESNLGKVQILSGLREGENVVTQGAFTLKSAVLRNSLMEEE